MPTGDTITGKDAKGRVEPQASTSGPAGPRRRVLPAAVGCALLVALFVGLALWGARHRSATYDEPMHSVAGYVLSRYGDFRANAEDPNLWQRWAALAEPRDALKLNFDDPQWKGIFKEEAQRWAWCVDTLYRTPGNDADAFLWRMRCMLVLLAVVAAGLVAWWGWRLGGGVAAVVAAALFCFDPNLLAHSTQVKNDLALTLVALALSFALWNAGRRLTWPAGLAVVVAMAAAPATKFSGVALVGVAIFLLAVRAWMDRPWPVLGRQLVTRPARFAAAGVLAVASLAAAYVLLWACYGFRFNPSPNPADATFDPDQTRLFVAINEISGRNRNANVSQSELDAWRPGPLVGFASWAERNHLLPQAWLHGLLMTYGGAQYRWSFLLGEYSPVGFPAYFPLSLLFKSPVGTIVAVLASLLAAGAISAARARRAAERLASRAAAAAADVAPAPRVPWLDAWAALCLLLPPALYFASAMGGNLNIGVRHVVAILPPLFVLVGWMAAVAVDRWGRRFGWVVGVILAAVAAETLLAAPNFLAFFNLPSGGARGGLRLLGDSNLDWGQDLPALADWQKRNPNRRLYLLHFGPVPPSYYGIRYVPLPGAHGLSLDGSLKQTDMPNEPGVVAVSATHLQGTYLNPTQRQMLARFRDARPTEVLNGTIYLFDLAAGK